MHKMSQLSISVAVPCYNEEQGINATLLKWHKYLSECDMINQFEIVISNDGSTDRTPMILDDLARHYPGIKVIHMTCNQGAATALYQAISQTQYDWVYLTDADDQFPIENLRLMMNALKESKVGVVMGMREKKQDHCIARWGSQFTGLICNFAHGSHLRDFNSTCKLIEGNLLRSITFETVGMNYSTEMTSRLLEKKIKFVQVAIKHQHRAFGKSKTKIVRDGFHRLLFVGYILFRQFLIKLGILRRPAA